MNYLLAGTEIYNLQKRRDAIIRESGCDSINVNFYRGHDWTMAEVLEDCQTLPFLSDKKVVIVENPDFLISPKENDPDLARLKAYLENSCFETNLIVYVDIPV
ncbi:MAG: hypothetical protein IJI05_02775, partial [Erysipelotrichaceae bacterium]|nr:hypothetical protein [Erysipelotrichaceae bacterium]